MCILQVTLFNRTPVVSMMFGRATESSAPLLGPCLSKNKFEMSKYRHKQLECPRIVNCTRRACGNKYFLDHEKPFVLFGYSCDAGNNRRCNVCFAQPALCKLASFAN